MQLFWLFFTLIMITGHTAFKAGVQLFRGRIWPAGSRNVEKNQHDAQIINLESGK
jgi:hypothetical protein